MRRLRGFQLAFTLFLSLYFLNRLFGSFLHVVGPFETLASFLALVLAFFSIIGVISTTILAWRKEERELKAHKIELAKKELEIVKLRHEVEQLKQPVEQLPS